jgi:hypothetical protein
MEKAPNPAEFAPVKLKELVKETERSLEQIADDPQVGDVIHHGFGAMNIAAMIKVVLLREEDNLLVWNNHKNKKLGTAGHFSDLRGDSSMSVERWKTNLDGNTGEQKVFLANEEFLGKINAQLHAAISENQEFGDLIKQNFPGTSSE